MTQRMTLSNITIIKYIHIYQYILICCDSKE
jgi:hypothetical protein